MIKDFFAALSTYGGRVGPPFTVSVVTIDWSTYLDGFETFKLPIWMIGWIADFADADNFEEVYMASDGDFAHFQNYTITNGWSGTRGTNFPEKNKDELIKIALRTPDSDPARGKIYADLDTIYIEDCPSLPIYQVTTRYWCKYWVKGWYYNALYPSDYYYKLYKEDTCWCDVTGPTIGTSDGSCNMRDIGCICAHFGAAAPDTSKTTPYDSLWAPGTYGYGGCDVYGDRKIDMRDVGVVCAHFGHRNTP
jgi:hypothetical protein